MPAKRIRPTTPSYLLNRVKQVQKRLQTTSADALLISHPPDIRYLTGFAGDDSWAVIKTTGHTVRIITDSRFELQVQRESPHTRVILRQSDLGSVLEKLMDRLDINKLAIQVEHTTIGQRKRLQKKLGARRLLDLDDSIVRIRSVKDAREIKLIRKALDIQEQAFCELLTWLKPGRTERAAAAYLEYTMQRLGADGPSFPTIIAADANAALPHAVPGQKKIGNRSMVLVDWGARYAGYCSDLTRIIAFGPMKRKLAEVYQVVLDAQMTAIRAVRPGRRLDEIDAVARKVISRAGYGEYFGHSLGHGLGLEIHELPVLSSRSRGELEPGQVVTVEPGIYLPGVGGVRIEDDVLVSDKGCTILSHLPKTLESAII